MTAPLLTVVVAPGGAPLAGSLRSILRQRVSLEVVLLDDGPQAARFAAADPRIRLAPGRSSAGAARNDGLAAARGSYVAFVDGGCLVADAAYERLVASLERTGSDFATGPIGRFGNRTRSRHQATAGPEFEIPRERVNLAGFPHLVADNSAGNKVFRLSFLRSQGIRWLEGTEFADLLPVTRAYARAAAIDVLGGPVIHYPDTPPPPGELADWLLGAGRAFPSLVTDASRATFAEAVLTREPHPLASTTFTGSPEFAERAARLVRELVAAAPAGTLASLPVWWRWELALVVLAKPELLGLVRNPDERVPADLDGLDGPLPEVLRDSLGLGDSPLPEAFARRFLRGPGARPLGNEVLPGSAAPEVSVIIAVQDAPESVDEVLGMVRAAVGVDLEVVVVDDNSSAATWDILQAHAAADPRVRVVRSPGSGLGEARNHGITLARGEYLAFAEDDDLVPPNAYAALLDAARRTRAEVVTGNFVRFGSTSTSASDRRFGYAIELDAITLATQPGLIRHRRCCNRLVRRDFWEGQASRFSAAPLLDDIVAVTGVLAAAERITVVPAISYIRREHPDAPGSEELLAGYLEEELRCARIVGQLDDLAVGRAYWDHVLGHEAWQHLSRYLLGLLGDGSDVARLHDSLLRLAPVPALRGLRPELQAVHALVRTGRLTAAATIVKAVEGSELALADALDALEAAAATGSLGGRELSLLEWRLLVRPIESDPALVTAELAERATALAHRLADSHGAVATTLPGTAEDRLGTVLRLGSGTDLLAALTPPTAFAELQLRPSQGVLTGAVDPSLTSYFAVLGSQPGREPVVLGHIRQDGTRWRAGLDPEAVPRSGRWDLLLEAEDAWGVVRRPLRVNTNGSAKLVGRLTRLGPTRPGGKSPALWVRAAPTIRARRALGALRRRLVR